MSKFGSFKDAKVVINGYDLSDHCEEITLNTNTAELPNSAMGDYTDFSSPGLLKWSLEAKFYTDFAAGSVHECFENLRASLASLGVPPTAPFNLGPSKTSPSGKPLWSGSVFVSKYKPIGGKHGDNLMVEVTLSAASNLSVSTA